MPRRKILLLMIAGLIALGTVAITRSMMTPVDVPPAPVAVPVMEILAATRDLPTGTILKESDMKWVGWPKEAETSKLYVKGTANMESLVGAVLREGLRADEPLIQGRVVQPHEQGFLAAVLTPGLRALSVNLTPSSGVAGFIFPGDHVDVILTHSFSRKDVSELTERRVSETVLTDVRVLALDQKSDSQTTDPKVAQLATLEVTPKQAEKLSLAQDMVSQSGMSHATLSLVLRSLASEDATAAPNADAHRGPTWDSDVSQAFPTVNGEDGLMQKVQIMRGKDITETNFERHH